MSLFSFFNRAGNSNTENHTNNSEDVRSFYNTYNDKFLAVYGDVIQAFRTTDTKKILAYEMQSMGMKNGMHVLDAGCGVCGPACYFANNMTVTIEALTVSDVQRDKSEENVVKNNVKNVVSVQQGDYHFLDERYGKDNFDLIYFLESFGHSTDKRKLLQASWNGLKPGGTVYIKDLFVRKGGVASIQESINKEIEIINKAYCYQVADLNLFLDIVREIGFVIEFVKTIDIKLEDFENLTISNDFQELTGIAKIENWDTYVFPVDFFEVRLYKPAYDIKEGMGRYFLQNILYGKPIN